MPVVGMMVREVIMMDREREHAATIREQFTKQAAPFAALAIHTHASSLELLRDGLALTGGERLLDAGCGPGLLLRYFAPHVRSVVGLDATPAMLAKARELLTEAKAENATVTEGNMEELPFADASFDAVVTRYTFHHLLHPGRAMSELVRVCKPGGRVVVCDATPRLDARDAYDAWERGRDASHSSARTEQELVALSSSLLSELHVSRFRLVASVRELLGGCFPADAEGLYQRMVDDVGVDGLDMAAHWESDELRMGFPISVISGTVSGRV
jgi:ubiquinone/menaquinone biosynthesis C-methylase UbiE